MTRLQEGDLRIALPNPAKVSKFDDPASHGLSHCMKAVDFVVEFEDWTLFLEVKDPDDPRAASRERQKRAARFRSDELDQDLVQKYRDSFLYQWATRQGAKADSLLGSRRLGATDGGRFTLASRRAAEEAAG